MKKRILSFILACFMVVSTFIISKPIVDAFAVENAGTRLDITPVFDGTSRFDTQGNVELAAYHRDRGIIRDNLSISVSGTTWSIYGIETGITASYPIFKGTVNGELDRAGGHHNESGWTSGDGYGSAMIFTAPRDGKYEFTFTMGSGWSGSTKCGTDIFIKTENGTVLDSASSAKDGQTMVVTATKVLDKGEQIFIIRSPQDLAVENISGNGAATLKIAQLDYVAVETERLDLTPVFDGTSLFDTEKNVELVGYKRDSGTYRDGLTAKIDGTSWYILDTNLWGYGSIQRLWTGSVGGAISLAGGNHYYSEYDPDKGDGIGSALIFTAPRNGKYEFVFSYNAGWAGNFKCGVETFIKDENGNVLDSARITTDSTTKKITAVVMLEGGETVQIVRCPMKEGENGIQEENRSTNGTASVSIAQLDYVPGNDPVEGERMDLTPVFDGKSRFDTLGNVELAAYHRDRGIFRDNLSVLISDTGWSIYGVEKGITASYPIFKGTINGELNRAGGHHNEAGWTSGDGYGSAMIFTAPRSGKYEFTFTMGSGWSGSTGCGTDIVIKTESGRILDSASSAKDSETMVVTATKVLDKGEQIFIIRSPQDLAAENISSNGLATLKIAQLAYVPGTVQTENETIDLTPVFDGTSFFDTTGNVELVGYKRDSGIYRDGLATKTDGTSWYVLDTNLWDYGSIQHLWAGNVGNAITFAGGNHYYSEYDPDKGDGIGSALIFTAPRDGKYEFTFTFNSGWAGSFKCGVDISIRDGDGNILDSVRANADSMTKMATAIVMLRRGEKIQIVRCPMKEGENGILEENKSTGGDASISIKEIYHACNAGSLEYVEANEAACEDGNVAYYKCACGLIYSDSSATQLLDSVVVPGNGHTISGYEADQTRHWNYCSVCYINVNYKNHTWKDGVCAVCDYACIHEWNGDNVCDNCGYDRTIDIAEENAETAIKNFINNGNANVNAVGPTNSLDRFIVTMPSGTVTGLEYKLFNLRFEGEQIILRHHFVAVGDIALYTFKVNGETKTPVNSGGAGYYIETYGEPGKLHVPDVITVEKGTESVDFSVSVYSYIAVALEGSTDQKVINVVKALYDYNEALYTASGDRSVLEITVDSQEISKFQSTRPYDPAKEDITLILVTGQSNFTRSAGFGWEYNHYYNLGLTLAPPVSPIVPEAESAYSFSYDATSFELNSASDMSYLSSPDRKGDIIGGITPVFGWRWNELTGKKIVFIQAAHGSTSIDEWVPDPENYDCGCSQGGTAYCYSKAVTGYKNAYAALSEKYNIVLTGYIFNQGESDETDKPNATVRDDQSYYKAYKSMHDGFMRELGLDFGGISVVRANNAGNTKEASSSYTKARAAQYKLCNDIENLYMLSTVSETCSRDMMDQGGTIHYSQAVFNVMGVDMANNLYSRLGFGTANAYDGVKLLNKNGYTITHIGANGELVSGSDYIDASSTAGRIIIKTSALGRDDTLSYKIMINGVDCSKYINGFGLIDWATLEAETGMDSLRIVVNVK